MATSDRLITNGLGQGYSAETESNSYIRDGYNGHIHVW